MNNTIGKSQSSFFSNISIDFELWKEQLNGVLEVALLCLQLSHLLWGYPLSSSQKHELFSLMSNVLCFWPKYEIWAKILRGNEEDGFICLWLLCCLMQFERVLRTQQFPRLTFPIYNGQLLDRVSSLPKIIEQSSCNHS